MNDIAFIFPGQGSQYVGMGKELYLNSAICRNVFDQAEGILNLDIKRICFAGPEDALKLTVFCQPAILTLSICLLEILKNSPKSKNFTPKFSLGLSLGEYSALVASEALSFEHALRLVKTRAEFMEECSISHPGKMSAIIGLDLEPLKEICKQTGAQIANINSPGQVVISGRKDSVDDAANLALKSGAKTAVNLDVSGAFHSSLMQEAANRFKDIIEDVETRHCLVCTPKFPVISNVTALPQTLPREIPENLIRQITSPVLWLDSINYCVSQGIKTFIEIGPGKVLKGILRRINSSLEVINIEKLQDIDSLSL